MDTQQAPLQGAGSWGTWQLAAEEGQPRGLPVVAYLHGLDDHNPAYRGEEATLLRNGYVWATVWSEVTGDDPDHAHVRVATVAHWLAPAEAAVLLNGVGADLRSLPAGPARKSLGALVPE